MLIVADATAEGLPIGKIFASIWRVLRRWGPMLRVKGQTNLSPAALTELVRTAGFGSVEGHALTGTAMNAGFARAVRPPDTI